MTVDRGAVRLGEFAFENGGSIPDLRVAYETYGEYTGDNAVLVCHVLTTSQHVAEPEPDGEGHSVDDAAVGASAWWDDIVGPGGYVDTDRYYVVCANVPGSCYGTSGPTSTDPETGEPYGTDFPPVTVGDWTRAQRRLLDHLGVDRLHAVVGGSVGGSNALEWARRYPSDVSRVVVIAAAARADEQCLALNAIARRAITSDPDWRGGNYYGGPHPDRGLMLARQLGHVRYLSKSSLSSKFGRQPSTRTPRRPFPPGPGAETFPYRELESYLDQQAQRFLERFDANSYLYLTRALDEFDLSADADSDDEALADFEGQALLLSFTGDWYCPAEQVEALAASFRAADVPVVHREIDSEYGHDAFLTEPEQVGPPMARFLADGVDRDGEGS